ncbi:hypothetical protein B566_EDAN001422 [Ephemera danica]|nr:hypothetical protein B566_EDAN001422 [Ephemera danica]
MAHVSRHTRKFCLLEDEAPEHNNTEGEKIIKDLVQKQTSTQISLTEQLHLQQNFVSSTELPSLATFKPGEHSLEQFSAQARIQDLEETFKRNGFNKEEVDMALDLQKGEKFFMEKHKKLERRILASKLTLIKAKIKSITDKSPFDTALKVGRHEQELLQSVQAQSDTSKVIKIVQSRQPIMEAKVYPGQHPMNHLLELDQQLFGHLKPSASPGKRKRKRKAVALRNQDNQDNQSTSNTKPTNLDDVPTSSSAQPTSRQEGSLWDMQQAPATVSGPITKQCTTKSRMYTCPVQRWYSVQDNKLQCLGTKLPPASPPRAEPKPAPGPAFVAPITSQLIPLEKIASHRLALNEIVKIPKFAEYKPGTPSKTLFIKNLSGSMTETDLVSLFGNFEDPDPAIPRLVYRLMSGKMKGQAFITFPCIAQASKAMKIVNGYQFKGRPIIIQYGKKS